MSCPMPNVLLDGDILAVHRVLRWYDPRTWLAARIRRVSTSYWNHVGILHLSRADGIWHVVEAVVGGGVVSTPFVWYKYRPNEYHLAVFRADLKFTERAEVAGWAMQQVGRPYDLAKIAAIRALQLLPDWILAPAAIPGIVTNTSGNALICSQLVIEAYRKVGLSLAGDYGGPGDVVRNPALRRVAS